MQEQVKKLIKEQVKTILKEEQRLQFGSPGNLFAKAKRDLKKAMTRAAGNFPISIRNDDWTLIREYAGQLTVMAKIQQILEDVDEGTLLRGGKQLSRVLNSLNLFTHKVSPEFQAEWEALQDLLERDWSQKD